MLSRKGIWCARYSPDGKSIIAGTSDSKLAQLPLNSDKANLHNLSDELSAICAMDFSPDGKTLALAGQNHKAVFMDMSKLGKKLSSVEGMPYII